MEYNNLVVLQGQDCHDPLPRAGPTLERGPRSTSARAIYMSNSQFGLTQYYIIDYKYMEYASNTLFTTRINNIQVTTQMSGPTPKYNCGTWIHIWYCSCCALELPGIFGERGE